MSDDPAVRLLRETFAAHEHRAPVPDDLARQARVRASGSGRRRWAVVAAATAVMLVATGVSIALSRGSGTLQPSVGVPTQSGQPLPQTELTSSTPAPAESTSGASSPRRSPTPAPTGWQAVSSLGVELAVPKDWPVVGAIEGCGGLPAAAVVRGDGFVAGCGYVEPPTFTLVQIGRPSVLRRLGVVGLATDATPSPQPLNRIPAYLTVHQLPDGRTEEILWADDRDAAVVLRGPDKALLQRIYATIQLADVDGVGCPALPAPQPQWDHDRGSVPKLAITRVSGISVCHYSALTDGSGQRLVASTRLTDPAAARLVSALNAAPAGSVPVADPQQCGMTTPQLPGVVVQLQHVDGSTEQVTLHYEGCGIRFMANAAGQSQVTKAVLAGVFDPLHLGYVIDGSMS